MTAAVLEIENKIMKLDYNEISMLKSWINNIEIKDMQTSPLHTLENEWDKLTPEKRDNLILNLLNNSVVINGDIISPIESHWEVLK